MISDVQIPVYRSVLWMHDPKPPLCKGRWHGEAVTEGLRIDAEYVMGCVAKSNAIPQSIASNRQLTAPFTQGGRWCGATIQLPDKSEYANKREPSHPMGDDSL